MHKGIYIIGLLLLLLASCTGDREVRALLERAEALMESNPDSAYETLSSLPLKGGELKGGSKADYMHTLLLLAEASNKLYKPLPSDTVFQDVVDYYDRHGDANRQLKAYYLMGCIYRDRHEAPMALQWYLDAIEKADTLADDCDYLTLMKIYGQMSDIYHSQLMPLEEIESRRQFSKCAEKAGDTYQVIRGIEKQLGAYQLMNDTAMILSLTDSVHDLYLQAGMLQAAASVFPSAIHIYLDQQNYPKAKQLMDVFETQSVLFDSEGNIAKTREHYYSSKGLYYEGISKLDSAKYYYHRLAESGYTLDAYRGLIRVFRKQHLADSVLSTVQLYEQAYLISVNQKDINAMRQVQSMYDYSRNQKIAYQKEIESKNRQIAIIVLCFMMALTIYIISYLYRKRKHLYLKAIKLINREKSAKWKIINRAERQAMQLSQKRDAISTLETKNKELRSQLHPHNNLSAETMLLDSKEVKAVTKYVSGSGMPTGDEWKNLERAFMKYMPNFYAFLNSHRLESLEKRVCYLTFMGIKPKVISLLLEISPTYLSNIRKGIKEKLEVNTKQSFESIILQSVKTLRE